MTFKNVGFETEAVVQNPFLCRSVYRRYIPPALKPVDGHDFESDFSAQDSFLPPLSFNAATRADAS